MTPAVQDLDRLLGRRTELAQQEVADTALAARMRALRAWQADRLAHTYADLRRDPRFAPATEFFLTDLYGAHGCGARDQQLARAWQFFRRLLPAAPLRALGRALELDVLTRELDHAMAAALPDGAPLDRTYADTYRRVARRDARERQIELAVGTGRDLERAVRHRGVGVLLKAAHAPARAAGLGELQDFIERGYQAFRALPAAGEFLATIRARETALMTRLFAGGDP